MNDEKKVKNWLDFLYILLKWRKFIIMNAFFVGVLTLIISFLIPKWFAASTTILPPSSEDGGMNFGAILDNLPIGGLGGIPGVGGASEEAAVFTAILNSRTVMDAVAIEFELQEKYKKKNLQETVRALRKVISFDVNEDGTLTLIARVKTKWIPTQAKDDSARNLAKDIANYFIKELDERNRIIKQQKATNNRQFIEKRFHQNQYDLKDAEEKFQAFQQKYGVIALPEQMEATITVAAQLKAEMTIKEIEVATLEGFVGNNNPELYKAKQELSAIKSEYNQFKKGQKSELFDTNSHSKDFLIPLDEIPDLGILYARLFREVMLQEKIMEFLLPQYEQAKIQEAKDTPTVQVLDEAIPPFRKAKPKRAILIIFMGFLSVVVSSLYCILLENYNEMRQEQTTTYRKLEKIKALFVK